MNTSISLRGFLDALGTFAYVALVGLFMSNASIVLGNEDTLLTPIFALTLFVVSAAITGGLVLGKPLMLYLDGTKHEALRLLVITVAWLVVFLVATATLMIALR